MSPRMRFLVLLSSTLLAVTPATLAGPPSLRDLTAGHSAPGTVDYPDGGLRRMGAVIGSDEENLSCAVIDPEGDYAYFGTNTQPDSHKIDYVILDVPRGVTTVPVLEPFPWPDTGSDTYSGLRFWGAVLDPGLEYVLSDVAVVEWGYGPTGG